MNFKAVERSDYGPEICPKGMTENTKSSVRTTGLFKFRDADNYTVLWKGTLK
jgi:hypothetical protein